MYLDPGQPSLQPVRTAIGTDVCRWTVSVVSHCEPFRARQVRRSDCLRTELSLSFHEIVRSECQSILIGCWFVLQLVKVTDGKQHVPCFSPPALDEGCTFGPDDFLLLSLWHLD